MTSLDICLVFSSRCYVVVSAAFELKARFAFIARRPFEVMPSVLDKIQETVEDVQNVLEKLQPCEIAGFR